MIFLSRDYADILIPGKHGTVTRYLKPIPYNTWKIVTRLQGIHSQYLQHNESKDQLMKVIYPHWDRITYHEQRTSRLLAIIGMKRIWNLVISFPGNFAFGGKSLQFWGEIYHWEWDGYFCLFLTQNSHYWQKFGPYSCDFFIFFKPWPCLPDAYSWNSLDPPISTPWPPLSISSRHTMGDFMWLQPFFSHVSFNQPWINGRENNFTKLFSVFLRISSILCLSSRTTVTSPCIPGEDALSHVQKESRH